MPTVREREPVSEIAKRQKLSTSSLKATGWILTLALGLVGLCSKVLGVQ